MATRKKTVDPEQLQMMSLNVAHLLFLHSLVFKLYEIDTKDSKMNAFLHDLLIMFEIYLEPFKIPENLAKQFNYSPLTTKNNEKANQTQNA